MLGLTSLCVFFLPALALSVTSGYSFAAVALLLASITLLWKRPRLNLQSKDKVLIAVLLAYFATYSTNVIYHGDPTRELDMPLRALLAVFPMLLLFAYPPQPKTWWAGVACGAISGAGVAIYQMIAYGEVRPYAATSNAIHYGNVSMLLGLLSASGIIWARKQQHAFAWTLLLALGFIAGVFGSVASSSRGGWIALPLFACIYVAHQARLHGINYLKKATLVVLVLFTLAYAIPNSPIRARTAIAMNEMNKFENTGNVDTSIGQRVEMWRTALAMSSENIWLGIGRTGYLKEKDELVSEGKMSKSVQAYTNAHNDYLDALVKRGVIGLVALLALFLVPLTMFARALRHGPASGQPYALAGVTLCLCYLIFGLTTTSLTLNIGILMLVFPLVILWSLLRHERSTG